MWPGETETLSERFDESTCYDADPESKDVLSLNSITLVWGVELAA